MDISLSDLLAQAAYYRALMEELRAQYAGIDEETLADTLEGVSDLPDALKAVIRSGLVDEALAEGLKSRLADMKARLERFENAAARKRALVCDTMIKADIEQLKAPDFSVSRRQGGPKLEVFDESLIPESFKTPQPPKLDRVGLLTSLKAGKFVPGAGLLTPEDHIQVRTK